MWEDEEDNGPSEDEIEDMEIERQIELDEERRIKAGTEAAEEATT